MLSHLDRGGARVGTAPRRRGCWWRCVPYALLSLRCPMELAYLPWHRDTAVVSAVQRHPAGGGRMAEDVSGSTLGVIFHPSFPPETLAAYARRAEAAGFDELWLWDDCFLPGALT